MRLEAELLPRLRGFEQRLKISVGPLPKRPLFAQMSPRVERLPQVDHQTSPLGVGQSPVQVGGLADADRRPEEFTLGRRSDLADVDPRRGSADQSRGDTDVAPDVLEFGEGQPSAWRIRRSVALLGLGRFVEDSSDLFLRVSAFGTHGCACLYWIMSGLPRVGMAPPLAMTTIEVLPIINQFEAPRG